MEKIVIMKKSVILFCLVLFFTSCKTFLKYTVEDDNINPFVIFAQVETPNYSGLAVMDLTCYYIICDKTLENYLIYDSCYMRLSKQGERKYHKQAYRDLKRNKIYVSDDTIHKCFIPLHDFDSNIYVVANQGIEKFIQTYFSIQNPYYFTYSWIEDSTFRRWQIAKIMFDAGIHIRANHEGWDLFIDDKRFFRRSNGGWKYVIPKYYIRKGKNWYKNTWQKQPKKPSCFK